MNPNWIGPALACVAFGSIWLGHVGVRKVEAACSKLWLPMAVTLSLGLGLEAVALVSTSQVISGAFGIVGMTLIWDTIEFRRQHHRVCRGHAPANASNPRHSMILEAYPDATSMNLLARDPAGQPILRDQAAPTSRAQEEAR